MSTAIDEETGLRSVRATLTVKLNYAADPTVTEDEISRQLERVIEHAAGEGWLSENLGDTEVDTWETSVAIGPVKPRLTETQMIGAARRLQVRLAVAGLSLSQEECAGLIRETMDVEPA